MDATEFEGQITIFEVLTREADVRGLLDDGYCPNCNSPLADLVPQCKWCGQLLSWERWKRINERS